MISFFTIARAFTGHFGVIQRNALRSWKSLDGRCEVILIGEDGGCAEAALEFGLIHVPEVARNECGSALVSDVFAAAQARARHDLICYVSADVILLGDFLAAAHRARDLCRPFLMGGRRWNLDVTEELSFGAGWDDDLRREVALRGRLDSPGCVDYLLFTRGLLGDIPPFAIGRKRWDRWIQHQARNRGAYIDATEAITAIHQNHDYGVLGFAGHKCGPESRRNIELAGSDFCDLRDAALKVTPAGIRRAIDSTRIRWRVQKRMRVIAGRLRILEDLIANALGDHQSRRLLRACKVLRRFIRSGSLQRSERIAVIGLGTVGVSLALGLASKGCTVVGVDADIGTLVALRSGRLPAAVSGLAPVLARAGSRLTIQMNIEKAISKANVIVLAAPTHLGDGIGSTLEALLTACERVGRVLATARGYRLVVVVSTVQPGSIGGVIQPMLERISGKRVGPEFGLCYLPHVGAAINTISEALPRRVQLIGESDPFAGKYAERLLRLIWGRSVTVPRTNLPGAEHATAATQC